MSVTHDYEVSLSWTAERRGELKAVGIDAGIDVATPPEFPKGMENIWSPEHLFVAAVNSCLMTTFLAIAENSKLEFLHFESHASGKLEQVDGKYLISEVRLQPVVTIADEQQKERAERVLQKSEQNCLISNSVNSKIIFEPIVTIVKTEQPV